MRAIELALKYKRDLAALGSLKELQLKEGPSVGAVWTVCQVARQLGIEKALGTQFTGKNGKLQIVIGLLCDESGEPVSTEVFPEPRATSRFLLQALDLHLPEALPHTDVPVVTRKKLPEQRKKR